MTFLCGLVAFLAGWDLFGDPPHRVPWWGDVLIMSGAALAYLMYEGISRGIQKGAE